MYLRSRRPCPEWNFLRMSTLVPIPLATGISHPKSSRTWQRLVPPEPQGLIHQEIDSQTLSNAPLLLLLGTSPQLKPKQLTRKIIYPTLQPLRCPLSLVHPCVSSFALLPFYPLSKPVRLQTTNISLHAPPPFVSAMLETPVLLARPMRSVVGTARPPNVSRVKARRLIREC